MDERHLTELVSAAAAGDADALQALLVRHHAEMRGIILTETDARLRAHLDPDDVLQQAYIAAFAALPDAAFESPAHFFNWLRKIALARLVDAQRALRRRKRDVARLAAVRLDASASYPNLLDRLTAGDPTPSRRFARDEAVAAVMSCLARLSPDQREVVRLRILEDVPVEQIAKRLGKTNASVYTLCHRGLKSLRTLMVSISRFLTHL